MTEYHKIETAYVRDLVTRKVNTNELKNPVYDLIKEWEWTEKIDGTNIRVMWNPGTDNPLSFGGRTDNANLPAELVNWLNANITIEKMTSTFPDNNVVIYGEGFGNKIQPYGSLYSPFQKFIVFDVLIGRWWLEHESVKSVATKLGLDTVPYIGKLPLATATNIVKDGFQSYILNPSSPLVRAPAEGLIGRVPFLDRNGKRLIIKLKTVDF